MTLRWPRVQQEEMFPHTNQILLRQRLFFSERTGNESSRIRQYPLLFPERFWKPALRVRCGRSESLARSPGWSHAPDGPGAQWAPLGRVWPVGFRPSNLSPQARTAGLPPAGRVHAYLLCSGKTRLSRSRGTGRLTALAIRPSPSTSPVPPRRVLTPSARHLIPPRIPALRFPASSTTLQPRPPWGPPSRPTHRAGPGVMSLPVDRQLGHRPPRARSVSTPRIPDCSPSGVPTGSVPFPVLPRYRLHKTAGQRRDSPAAATARQCGGRGAREAEPESPERGGSQRLGARPAPRRRF